MTCSFDQESVALYAAGDLDDEEMRPVERHVGSCAHCRRAAALFRRDAAAIAGAGAGVVPAGLLHPDRPGPTTGSPAPASGRLADRAPSRRGAAWAAAAAAVLFLLLLTPSVRALGDRLIELFPFLHIREMSGEELRRELDRPPTGGVEYPAEFESVAAAERAVGYPIARLGRVPDEFAADRIQVSFPHQPINSTVVQRFRDESRDLTISLSQTRSGRIVALTEEGMTRQVGVRGEPAGLITLTALDPQEGSRLNRSLHFQWKGQAVSLTVYGPASEAAAISDAEMIRMAESLK